MAFTLTHDQRDGLPRYRLTARDGANITEFTAQPRTGAQIVVPEPWFAATPEGEGLREQARLSLASGSPVRLDGEHVGIDPGTVPDRFRQLLRDDGLLRDGQLGLGVSDQLAMTVTFTVPHNGGVQVAQSLALHMVPPLAGDSISYAGMVGGTMLALNLREDPQALELGDGEERIVGFVAITLFLEGQSAEAALRGLAFAGAFEQANGVHFDCRGLLPDGGIASDGPAPAQADARSIWRAAARIASALAGLNRRDGGARRMPATVTPQDGALTELVLHLLVNGEYRAAASGEFEAPIPSTADPDGDPAEWTRFETTLPDLCRQPTGMRIEQAIIDAVPARIRRTGPGAMRLVCRAAEGGAAIRTRLLP